MPPTPSPDAAPAKAPAGPSRTSAPKASQGPQRPNRDSVTTIRADGSRFFLHPADVHGRFAWARRAVAALLIGVYGLLPWIPVGGHPAVFLDVANRRFHLFGLTLAAQDIWFAFFLITGVGFSLFLVTALLGRLWCGWACPQTVFLEHVFRRIERALEGDAPARRRLDAAPWTASKIARRTLKHALFFLVSAAIAHLFLAYFVSLPGLYQMMTHAPADHWGAFLFVFAASLVLYGNFVWFREQLCLIICPYGRLQSVLVDDHTVTIAYDETRGEPRGKAGPGGSRPEGIGDCVDCNRCVQVCPTGIDIRQGLQLECIACSACIDACDDVMTRLKRPTGLVRYASLENLRGRRTRWIRPRTWLYATLLLIGASVATWSLGKLKPAIVTAFRLPGRPYYVDESAVRNQFLVRILNKTNHEEVYTLRIVGGGTPSDFLGIGEPLAVPPLGEETRPIVILKPRTSYAGEETLTLQVITSDGRATMERRLEFVGPSPALLRSE